MSVLRRLTVAQIRGSKSRFVVTVIGVMLSAAMIAAVLLGSDSVMDAMRRGVAGIPEIQIPGPSLPKSSWQCGDSARAC